MVLTCAAGLRPVPLSADLTRPPGGATEVVARVTPEGGDTAVGHSTRGRHTTIRWRCCSGTRDRYKVKVNKVKILQASVIEKTKYL